VGIFYTHVDPFEENKISLTLLGDFFLFGHPKTHFRITRHENKEKRLFYFGLGILLPI
jgi:hypothetical protein